MQTSVTWRRPDLLFPPLFDTIFFDVDGVLIRTTDSFHATDIAVAEYVAGTIHGLDWGQSEGKALVTMEYVNAFKQAGVSERTEVRVGNALDLLPHLENEAPFDLIFIDADKPPYPQYLDWALRLSRPGSIIVADNCIRSGKGFEESQDEGMAGIVAYNKRIASDARLISLDLAMDDDYTDGFAISVVRQ